MKPKKQPEDASTHYFVDESGDGVLFGSQGRVLSGSSLVGSHFMLGVLQVQQPAVLAAELEALRQDLLKDPYFKTVPSMQAARQKTALMFHAKDDVPEVRREVFKLLARHEMKFYAVVRDMRYVLAYVQERNARDANYRYHPNELYDQTVARLFKDRLHSYETCKINFAVRGTADRTRAFQDALTLARSRFEQKWNKPVNTQIELIASSPRKEPCIQAVDYMLWALQRYYCKGESRFIEMLWGKVGLIHDVDDKALAAYGTYYTKKKPLPELPGAAL
jgi:Protein of unknown function (DUF3800)